MTMVRFLAIISKNSKSLGRWYLVSGDSHILGAYLQHKDAFRIKPCILPVYFLELLRRSPETAADDASFGAILHSEAMLRGVGRNYGSIIAALTKVGINALTLPRERLLELIEDMDRADFTQWLLSIRGGRRITDEVREKIVRTLENVLKESASREQRIDELKHLAKQSHDEEKLRSKAEELLSDRNDDDKE